MKTIFRFFVIVTTIVVAASVVGALYYYNRINNEYGDDTTYIFSDDPKYHFSLILNSHHDVYWQSFKEGVFEAAKIYSAAIEFNPVEDLESSKMMEYISIATKSKVDGIIINGRNTDELSEVINDAAAHNIYIIMAGEEVQTNDSKMLSLVGTNFYEYGMQAAKLIGQTGDDHQKVNLAVILSGEYSDEAENVGSMQNNMMMIGLKKVIDQDGRINLLDTLKRSNDLLGAEDLTRSILTQHQDVDVIFCTNEKDTIAAARVIVERNLVGRVMVVGTDVTQEIINYINKGIIYGVIDRNGYDAGYKSVEMLINSIGETFQSNYEDVDIDIYTKMNISTYKQRVKQ